MLKNFKPGNKVKSIDEIFKYDSFIWRGKFYNRGFLVSWQTIFLYNEIRKGRIFIAEKINKGESNESNNECSGV